MQQFQAEDPELAKEIAAEMGGDAMGMVAAMAEFDYDMLRANLGPIVWSLRNVENGFILKSYVLEAATE